MVEYHIERLNDKNATKWDEFNNDSREGSFFHTLKWKHILDRSSDFKSHYYLLFKNDSVFGILPFVEQNFRFFRGLVPAQRPCNLHAIIRDCRDPSVLQFVLTELQNINRHPRNISFIRFSTLHKDLIDTIVNYPVFTYPQSGNMVINLLECPPEKIWNNFSAKKGQRTKINRFDKHGFKVTEVNSKDDLKLFYNYYKKNITFIGGTPETFTHFANLLDSLTSNELRISIVSKDSTIAGGHLMFLSKPLKTAYITYLSINRDLPTTYHPTYYFYWEAINWAWNNNYEKISFGATSLNENNPHYQIKNEFGGKFEPVYSKMIAVNKMFALGYKCYKYFKR